MRSLASRIAAVVVVSCGYQAALFLAGRVPAIAIKDVVIVLASATGAWVAGRRAYRERGAARRTWTLTLLTSVAFTVGNALYGLSDLLAWHPARPAPADLCVLVAAALVPLTLMSVPTAPHTLDGRLRMLFDGMICTSVLFFVGWATVMRPMYESIHPGSEAALALVVPGLETVSLAVVVLQLLGRRRGAHPAMTVMGVGYAVFAVTSTAYTYLLVRQWPAVRIGLEGGFLGATLLLVLAARLPMPSAEQRRWEPATGLRGSAPYLGVGTAVAAAAVLQFRSGRLDPVLLWVVLLMAGLVLLRQFLTLRANDRLVRELHEQRAQLAHQASHDQLTGLANRYLLGTRLGEALAWAGRHGRSVAVLIIDLDGFKPVNDTFGHGAGDQVLVATARRLARSVRPGDTVARLGGDEFAVVLVDVPDGLAGPLVDRILDVLAEPVAIPQSLVTVRASVGVAVTDTPASTDPEALLNRADVALYRAKTDGRGRARWYDGAYDGATVAPDVVPAAPLRHTAHR